jgi:multiple sugar transport system ATP-binding protein
MNLLKGKWKKSTADWPLSGGQGPFLTVPSVPAETLAANYVGRPLFRHSSRTPTNEVSADHIPITATIEISEPMGSESIVYFKAATGSLIARVPGEHIYHPGEQLTVQLNMEKVHLFDAQTEQVIK